MNKGFLTLAQNGKYDYLKMAYALAMSLKISQTKNSNLSVIVNKDDKVPEKYLKVFDKVIPVEKPNTEWKIQNKHRYFELTPYDETIVLDTDMLFFHDISYWWDQLGLYNDIEFTSHVVNYRGDICTSDFYRKIFTKNKLPNLYTALFYFRKTPEIEAYFKLVGVMFEYWEKFYEKFLKNPPKFLSGDVIYSLASKLMFDRKWDNFLTFTHMRSRLQDTKLVEDWNKYLTIFFTKSAGTIGLKINNFNQLYPFHYIKKDFLKSEVIELYENETAIRLL